MEKDVNEILAIAIALAQATQAGMLACHAMMNVPCACDDPKCPVTRLQVRAKAFIDEAHAIADESNADRARPAPAVS